MKKYALASLLFVPFFAFASGPDVNSILLSLVKLYGQEVQQLNDEITSLKAAHACTPTFGSTQPILDEVKKEINNWDNQIAVNQDKLNSDLIALEKEGCDLKSQQPSDTCKSLWKDQSDRKLQNQILKDQIAAIHISF